MFLGERIYERSWVKLDRKNFEFRGWSHSRVSFGIWIFEYFEPSKNKSPPEIILLEKTS